MKAIDLHGRALVGRRIEIPVYYDYWMRGARFGVVTSFRSDTAGRSAFIRVKLDDAPRVRLKVWAMDWESCKLL
jgi:hypothetical protein